MVADIMVITPKAGDDFVETPYVAQLAERALAYVQAGFPVHFRGSSGTGKTTLALHVAHGLGRPVMLITGDDEFGSSELVGAPLGYRRRRVVDRFVHSVVKTEESVTQQWIDNRLTLACREGLTLVYDEFTRSRPEANNVLLSVLEERILVLPSARGRTVYIPVHPDFGALFTSNPAEYAGVHSAQDALIERMVTIDMAHLDEQTEKAITQARSGVSEADAAVIVRIVRACRQALGDPTIPTVRSAIMIACMLAPRGARARAGDPLFERVCLDLLASGPGRHGWDGLTPDAVQELVLRVVREHADGATRRRKGSKPDGATRRRKGSKQGTEPT